MALKSGLTLWVYKPDGTFVVPYLRELMSLEFSTNAPGGYGDLRATIKLPPPLARLPQPQFAPFSRLVVMGHGVTGPRALWIGEVSDYVLELAKSGGEQVLLTGLGIGNCMRDDPQIVAYSGKTAQQIAIDQLSGNINSGLVPRATMWPLSQDTGLLFPDNPAATYSPAYINRNAEEVIQDITTLAGDYLWLVLAHATKTDSAGFPLGQLQAQLRDTTTTHYTAGLLTREIQAYRIAQSMDKAYNDIRVTSYDTTNGVQLSEQKDSRLGAGGAQGTAPFRQRALVRAYEGISTVTSAKANTLATTMLSLMKNISSKVSITCAAIRDGNGNPVPLEEVRAGRNIFVPEMAGRGSQLVAGAVSGVNQYAIISTRYYEGGNTRRLELECDNYRDDSTTLLARLQLVADALARVQRTAGQVTALGASVKGWYEVLGNVAGAGVTSGAGVTYPSGALSSTPTSITLSSAFANNSTNLRTANIGTLGFTVLEDSTGAGASENNGTYVTVGN